LTIYKPEIDSLRAISVLAVIFFHFQLLSLSGGFLGVDVFFVISGFLISSIIFHDISENKFSFLNFYSRRVRRLFPALFLVCIVTIPIAYFNYRPDELKFFGLTLTSVIFFVSNILFYNTTSYFNDIANHSPLLHTWSLSVEEQFYLFFPLIIFIFNKKLSMKFFLTFIIFLSLASLAYSEYSSLNSKDNYFFLLSNRIFELGIGIICAYISFFYKKKHQSNLLNHSFLADFLAVIGIISIIASFFIFDDYSNMPGLLSLIPTLGTGIFILTIRENSFLSRLMSFKYFSGLGKISYSLYLWHFPLIIFIPNLKNSDFIYISILLLIFLSFLTYKFVEHPIRYNVIFANKYTLYILFLIGFLILLIGVVFTVTNGFKKQYINKLNLNELELFQSIKKTKQYKQNSPLEACKIKEKNFTKDFINKFQICLKKHKSFIFVLGDSHATDLFNVIAHESSHPFVVGIAEGGCRPHSPKKKCHYQNSINFVHYYKKNIKSIFYTQKGSYFLTNFVNLPINYDFIKKTKAYVDMLDTGNYPVIWIGPNIEPNIPFDNKIQDTLLSEKKMLSYMNKNIDDVDQSIKSYLSQSSIIYFSKIKLMDFVLKRDFYVDKNFTYSDNDHWSAFGEIYFGKKIFSHPEISKFIN
tara:strand:+ start:353 stop:2272 length:1920 start_codon:yes stop_codon:yes gene_type:complete